MFEPVAIAKLAALAAVCGLLTPSATIVYLAVSEFRHRLKDDVSTRVAARAFPTFVSGYIRYEPDPRALVTYSLGLAAAGAVVVTALSIFVVGLVEVVANV